MKMKKRIQVVEISCLLVLGVLCICRAAEWTDDFSGYAEGTGGRPNWESDGLGWRVKDGAMLGGIGGWSSELPLAERILYKEVRFEADFSPEEVKGKGWKTAGVRLLQDARNYWHLALVESPEDQNRRHFVELCEMRDGKWLSQTNLTQSAGRGRDYDWQYGHVYRLAISLTPDGIEGTMTDDAGQVLTHLAFRFSAEAVVQGRPALFTNQITGSFDDVRVVGNRDTSVMMPEPQEKTFPEYAVPGTGIKARTEASGFFQVEQDKGKWWLVDPRGERFYAVGTDHVNYRTHWCQTLGYAPYNRNCERIYGGIGKWADSSVTRLREWGFNLLGANNVLEVRYKGLAHTLFVAFGSSFSGTSALVEKVHWTGFPNVFDPLWPAFCEMRARKQCSENKGDPWLLGYFLDNELEWFGKSHRETGIWEETMKWPADHSGKRALVDHLRNAYPNVAAFNTAWQQNISAWDELLSLTELRAPTDETRAVQTAFLADVADRYFRVTAEAIRRADPNHLVIGSRFAGNAPVWAWKACAAYCDVVTFNHYPRIDFVSGDLRNIGGIFEGYYAMVQRPMMITEWSFPALDSGLPCRHGAGMRVDTQEQKAACYEVMQHLLFRLSFMVGSDYFMWADEPAQGISDTFPEDSNYGLVNVEDVPYPELTGMCRRLNPLAAALHGGTVPEVYLDELTLDGAVARVLLRNAGSTPAQVRLGLSEGTETVTQAMQIDPGELSVDIPFPIDPGLHTVTASVEPSAEWVPRGCRGGRSLTVYVNTGTDQATILMNTSPIATVSAPLILPSPAGAAPWDMVSDSGDRFPLLPLTASRGVALLPPLTPNQALRVLLKQSSEQSQIPAGIRVTRKGTGYVIDNGVLTLSHGGTDGNVIDLITVGDLPLGSYNPLIWQRPRENQWIQADRLVSAEIVPLGNAVALDVTSEYRGEAAPITAVDAEGRQAERSGTPVRFRVRHRVIVFPGLPILAAACLGIDNVDSSRELTVMAYFFYLKSAIGGSPDGDVPDGVLDVPNYYKRTHVTSWHDSDSGGFYGCVPVGPHALAHFWLDPGGMQHPDARVALDEPRLLKPGESFIPDGEDVLLIYGARTDSADAADWRNVQAALTTTERIRAIAPIPLAQSGARK